MKAPPADFGDAQRRHWEDAELLFAGERWANADHLYGLCAECGLKQIMRAEGMPVDPTGRPRQAEHRRHIRDLWPIFESFVGKRRGASDLRRLPQGQPFADWSVEDRYIHRSHIVPRAVACHRQAALSIVAMAARISQWGQP